MDVIEPGTAKIVADTDPKYWLRLATTTYTANAFAGSIPIRNGYIRDSVTNTDTPGINPDMTPKKVATRKETTISIISTIS
jgi:hypothetical protein